MINVSATEFQNKIGYYTSLLEKGIVIRLEKNKPIKKTLLISAKVDTAENKTKKQRILELIEKNKGYQPKYYKSGLDLQNSVRE